MTSGFSIKQFGPQDKIAYRVEPGFQFAFRRDGSNAWLYAVMSKDLAERTMKEIEMAVDVGKLEAFTLFYNPGKGWQMSTRRKGAREWSIQQGLADDVVRPIFNLLEPIGHLDGPLQIQQPPNGAERGLFNGLTAAILARVAG